MEVRPPPQRRLDVARPRGFATAARAPDCPLWDAYATQIGGDMVSLSGVLSDRPPLVQSITVAPLAVRITRL